MQADSHIKSGMKSVLWRVMGIVVLAVITYAFTRSWIQTSLVTVIHHGVFLFVFYLHERLWIWIDWKSRWRHVAKCITYETILGNVILGLITYLVTGSVKQMTVITLTYIGTKHVMYVLYDWMWDKFRRKIKVYAYVVGDLLHVGHLRHLEGSKALGDYLIVGVLTDEACMEKKPKPIIPFDQRLEMVQALGCVDRAVAQYAYSPSANVIMYKPDVLVESESHREQPANDLAKEVVVLPYHHGISTTIIKKAILDNSNVHDMEEVENGMGRYKLEGRPTLPKIKADSP